MNSACVDLIYYYVVSRDRGRVTPDVAQSRQGFVTGDLRYRRRVAMNSRECPIHKKHCIFGSFSLTKAVYSKYPFSPNVTVMSKAITVWVSNDTTFWNFRSFKMK